MAGGGRWGPAVRLGLKENLGQFALPVLDQRLRRQDGRPRAHGGAFVGTQEFGLVLRTAVFSFLVTFGLVKACSDLFASGLADRFGRKKVLVAGWWACRSPS